MIDLHTHTIYSDGEYSPNKLILEAKSLGIKILSITDHNTTLAYKNITLSKEERSGIKLIPGIELSAQVPKGQMHILGYGIDVDDVNLSTVTKKLKNSSFYSVMGIFTQIKIDYGISFSLEDILQILNREGNIGRPDIARLCVKYGVSQSVKEAFDMYLTAAYQKTKKLRENLSSEECIKTIVDSKGIPILAHPKTLRLNDEDLKITIEKLIAHGLKGIEVHHSSHTQTEVEKYYQLAKYFNLLISGGTDFHGPNTKPNIKLGSGINNNIKIKKLSLIDKL